MLVTSVAIPCFELSLFLCKAKHDDMISQHNKFHLWSTFPQRFPPSGATSFPEPPGMRTIRALWERDKKWQEKATRSLACAVLPFSATNQNTCCYTDTPYFSTCFCVCCVSFGSWKWRPVPTKKAVTMKVLVETAMLFSIVSGLYLGTIYEALMSEFCCTVFHSFVYTVKSFMRLFVDR